MGCISLFSLCLPDMFCFSTGLRFDSTSILLVQRLLTQGQTSMPTQTVFIKFMYLSCPCRVQVGYTLSLFRIKIHICCSVSSGFGVSQLISFQCDTLSHILNLKIAFVALGVLFHDHELFLRLWFALLWNCGECVSVNGRTHYWGSRVGWRRREKARVFFPSSLTPPWSAVGAKYKTPHTTSSPIWIWSWFHFFPFSLVKIPGMGFYHWLFLEDHCSSQKKCLQICRHCVLNTM